MRTIFLAASLALLCGQSASAQTVRGCDTFEANARNVVWADPTRTFAEGAIRFVALDTIEPAAASFHIMVTFPPPKEPFALCRLIALDGSLGYSGVALSQATARYDPERGLTVSVPVDVYDPGSGDLAAASVAVTVNRATGRVTAE